MKEIRIVYEGGEGSIEEKKSRFIATVFPVHTEEEVLAHIAALKKKYWDARHNCFAYVIGDNGQLQRCSDDGEPQGTAGRPMLEVLLAQNLRNVLVVVTRYFGGVLLGTGGLVRAYSKAVTEGLKNSTVLTRKEGFLLTIQTDYTDLGKVQYLLASSEATVLDTVYTDLVQTQVLVPEELLQHLKNEITENTGGRAQYPAEEPVSFAVDDDNKNPVLL